MLNAVKIEKLLHLFFYISINLKLIDLKNYMQNIYSII